MSYMEKAGKIRNKLARYKKESVLHHTLAYLHSQEENNFDTVKKMPWLAFLLIEWLYQVDESPNARLADRKTIYSILNEMYQLQSEALSFGEDANMHLALRKMIIGQLWVQKNKMYYFFAMVRLYALLIGPEVSTSFSDDFKKTNNISLSDFFGLSLWALLKLDQNSMSIAYERVVIELTPFYPIDVVVTFLEIVGGNIFQLEDMLKEKKDESIKVDSYFYDSLLFKKPLIFSENNIVVVHRILLTKAISEFSVEKFKSNNHQRFRNKFSKEFERYINIVIGESGLECISEAEIKSIYSEENLTGKAVDFLMTDCDSTVFIEVKGIEPHRRVKVSDDPVLLRDKLRSSFIYGVQQSYECASKLLSSGKVDIADYKNRFALIVTHQEFYISNGKKLNELIGASLFKGFDEDYCDQIPLENIYFICIEDFEGIMKICKDSETKLSDFLKFCVESDSDVETMKFDLRQHLYEYARLVFDVEYSPIGTDYIIERKDRLFGVLSDCLIHNSQYWRCGGVNRAREYMFRHNLIKSRLGLNVDFPQ